MVEEDSSSPKHQASWRRVRDLHAFVSGPSKRRNTDPKWRGWIDFFRLVGRRRRPHRQKNVKVGGAQMKESGDHR
ncbi:NB-ARC domain-containing protein [Psidium guajava]|nr:NB-ARC domain-containing protein [Psidium guajava]